MNNVLKKFAVINLAILLVFSLMASSCAFFKEKKIDVPDNITAKSFPVTEDYVKTQGRTYNYDDCCWLIQSASAVEFKFTGTNGSVVIHGDQNSFESWAENNLARLGIFVNGEKVVDELVDNYVKEYTFLDTDEPVDATVKIVKLSDPAESVVGIKSINVKSKGNIIPIPENQYKIEFIGDSITCGVGIDDANPNGKYCTASENASKTYAYKVAQKFNADYSFFAYSGYGVVSGYSSSGNKNIKSTIPPIYETLGYSMGKIAEEITCKEVEWDFLWQPDLIIINLGTNDSTYAKTKETKKEYEEAYISFLKQLRKNNPDANILCTLGLAGTGLYNNMTSAAELYTQETGDTKVRCLKLTQVQPEDGFGVQYHPLEKTNQRAANEIVSYVEEWLGWKTN